MPGVLQYILWVNLLVLCFQGRVTYVLFRRCHTFIRHRPFYWKGWGLRFFKENYPKLFEFFFYLQVVPKSFFVSFST